MSGPLSPLTCQPQEYCRRPATQRFAKVVGVEERGGACFLFEPFALRLAIYEGADQAPGEGPVSFCPTLAPDSRTSCRRPATRHFGCWWIRLRGRARVLDDGEEREDATALLQEKYPQYRTEPPNGPVLAVEVIDVREWTA